MRTNLLLKKHHGWSIDEIENRLPWEKKIYMSMIAEYVENEEKIKQDVKVQQHKNPFFNKGIMPIV